MPHNGALSVQNFTMTELVIEEAAEVDIPLILELIKELAVAENYPGDVTATEEELKTNLFGEQPAAEVLLLYVKDAPAGYIIFYHSFSTITGKKGLHLEDLYVRPQFQGLGIGKKALGRLATIAKNRGCGRFEWWALKWNNMATSFYQSIGARKMKELRIFRLQGEEIEIVSEQLDR